MMMPSIFGEDLFDDFMRDFPFYHDRDRKQIDRKLYGHHGGHVMKTDIKETDNGYEFEIDLPGFSKEEVKASLKDGCLTISACKEVHKDKEDKKNGRYLRRERYTGARERAFYVGEDVTEKDIKGEFKHGILKLFVPKVEKKPVVEEKKFITIE